MQLPDVIRPRRVSRESPLVRYACAQWSLGGIGTPNLNAERLSDSRARVSENEAVCTDRA